jgi:2-phospho-L-lactate transferase/gluconeogenesis factor (CofD/UPF0052 family)
MNKEQINVALFSGGSGTHSITAALMRHPQIRLRILINAYDDGHSTGRLREFIPGMLGPSDVRKNINRLAPVTERGQKALKAISDERLPVGIPRAEALVLVEALSQGRHTSLPPKYADAYRHLSIGSAARLRAFLEIFLKYFHEQEAIGRTFDFTDCAVGNLLFAGCHLEQDRDFNRAMRAFAEFYEVDPNILLNVTLGENLFLVARKEDGTILRNEADIVAAQSVARITELFLIDEATYRNSVENLSIQGEELERIVRAAALIPQLNPDAASAIQEADLIIYGPGTQHSSLFPSYMTAGVANAIAANRSADKIFIGNIHRDLDIQQDDINDLARKFLASMNFPTTHDTPALAGAPVQWVDVVTQFFVQSTESGNDGAKYIPFDEKKFPYPIETVRLRDWESQEGRHAGGFVMDEVRQIVQARIDIELESQQHMVSIVVPVLNEERKLGEVLRELTAIDFQDLDLTKEILVVDGGSSDRSREIARGMKNVKLLELPGTVSGRGAALRLGIERARGNLIVFYAGDGEYQTADLKAIVANLAQSKYKAVFGTRAVKVKNLSDQLKKIYQDNLKLYLTSKYGGILLSVTALLLYNRYVSDILTSLKAFDAKLLKSLALESNGRDLESEIVAKLAKRGDFMLELPVEYTPRLHSEGKKITIGDGFQTLWALFRYR